MPIRRSRSYYMRNRATLSTPPICRSKATTVCNLQYTLCPIGSPLEQLYRYGLTLPQAEALEASVRPSRGSIWYQDKTNGIAYQDIWDDCPSQLGPWTPHAWLGGWTSPEFITHEDNLCASTPMGIAGTSNPNTWTSFNAAVPLGSTIVGLQFDVRWSYSPAFSSIHDLVIQPSFAGAPAGTNLAAGAIAPAALGFISYGGPTNLCGLAPTPTMINDPSFGLTTQYQRAATPPPGPIAINLDVINLYVWISGP